jgi:carboxypeptidase PM20D1
LDVKVTAVQLLEAVTALLRQGYAPERTILLAFGHDEEVGGDYGETAAAPTTPKSSKSGVVCL